jgi:hypothetical protein
VAYGQLTDGSADSRSGSLKCVSNDLHHSNGPIGTGAFLGGGYSVKDVIAYGGILEESQLGGSIK